MTLRVKTPYSLVGEYQNFTEMYTLLREDGSSTVLETSVYMYQTIRRQSLYNLGEREGGEEN